MRRRSRAVLVALACAVAAGSAAAAGDPAGTLAAQIAASERARALVAARRDDRAGDLRARARAAYKALRAGAAPLWFDRDARRDAARRRAAVRRLLRADLDEIAALDLELATLDAGRARLEQAQRRAAWLEPPEPGSLFPPVLGRVVRGFGAAEHASGARVVRRGIELDTRRGHNVRAVADGTLEYFGPVRGLGLTAVLDHEGFLAVYGGLQPSASAPRRVGDLVERGEIIAEAAGDALHLEVRLDLGPGATPLDPQPLLGER